MSDLFIVLQFFLDGFDTFFHVFTVIQVNMPEHTLVGTIAMSEILTMITTMMILVVLVPFLQVLCYVGIDKSIVIKEVNAFVNIDNDMEK